MNRSQLKQVIIFCAIFLPTYNSFCLGQTMDAEVKEFESGPLIDQRKQLYQKILESKQQGVGVASYLSVFKSLEQQIKQGVPPEKISQQIKSLNESLSTQLVRSKALKIQHPIPLEAKAQNTLSKDTVDSTTDPTDKILKLKDQLENLPPGIIPDNLSSKVKEKLKDPKTRKELLEKLQGL